jgi:hypothetical protein
MLVNVLSKGDGRYARATKSVTLVPTWGRWEWHQDWWYVPTPKSFCGRKTTQNVEGQMELYCLKHFFKLEGAADSQPHSAAPQGR